MSSAGICSSAASSSGMSKRSSSRRDLRKASRPPSLNTVWEWQGETVEAVPATTEALLMDGGEPMSLDEPMNGPLELRSSAGLRWLSRRTWNARYGVLQPATSSMPTPRLLMFDSGERGHLHEEILLVAPLQLVALPCPQHAPPDGGSGLMRFTLSSGDASPLELAAHSDEQRQLWIFALGESMHSSSPVPRSPTSVLPKLSGKVRLKQCKLSDNYQMGKILAKGEDYLIVEGVHLHSRQSRTLKLLRKRSPRMRLCQEGLRSRVCSRLLGQCLEEVYEGANHVCIVMHWGTHELDAHHQLAASVLEALRLLRELVPPTEVPAGDLMLQKADAQRLMMRAVELDCHLQSNLFI